MSAGRMPGRGEPADTVASGVGTGIVATLIGQIVLVVGVLGLSGILPLDEVRVLLFLPGLTQVLYMAPLVVRAGGRSRRRHVLGLLAVAAVVFVLNGLVCGALIASFRH